jgi:hypothetical protein
VTTTETTTASATSKAADKAIKAVAAASETLPTVVETAEVAMTVPSKVVLNQKLIVIVTAVTAAAAGAGVLWGVTKFRNRNKVTVEVPNNVDDANDITTNH